MPKGALIIKVGGSPEDLKRKRVMEGDGEEESEGGTEDLEAMEDFISAVKSGDASAAMDILRDLVSMM